MCFCQVFTLKALWESGTLLNEVKLWERESGDHKRQNKRVHNNVDQAGLLYVQFTLAQTTNEFMNDRSLNTFRHNTACRWVISNALGHLLCLKSVIPVWHRYILLLLFQTICLPGLRAIVWWPRAKSHSLFIYLVSVAILCWTSK